MYGLRDYQQRVVRELYQCWANGDKSVLLQLPTAAGKTVTFGKVASDAISKGYQVLILAHRKELICQAADKVGSITGVEPSIIKSGYKPNLHSPLQVASIQTLVRRLDLPLYPKLIIYDECHHSTSSSSLSILNNFPNAYLLGVTATPVRLSGEGFEHIFDSMVIGPSVKELIDKGYLSRFKLFADPNPMSTKGVKSQGGDYKKGDLAKANDAIQLSGNLVQSYKRHCDGKRCIVFAINVDHSIQIAKRYNEAGIPAAHLDGTTPESVRQETIEAFHRGELLVLSNVGLFDEGFDLPALDAVQIAKPTKSLTRWLQMVGRVLRTSPDKEYSVILDHTLNWAIHGLPTRERTWSLEGVEQVQEPIKICKDTGEVVPNPEKELTGIEELDVHLIEVEEEEEKYIEWKEFFEALKYYQQDQGFSKGWLMYKVEPLFPPMAIWQSYAEYAGYKLGWAYYKSKDQPRVRHHPPDIDRFLSKLGDRRVPITLPLDPRKFA